jgi:hypothetical protein
LKYSRIPSGGLAALGASQNRFTGALGLNYGVAIHGLEMWPEAGEKTSIITGLGRILHDCNQCVARLSFFTGALIDRAMGTLGSQASRRHRMLHLGEICSIKFGLIWNKSEIRTLGPLGAALFKS